MGSEKQSRLLSFEQALQVSLPSPEIALHHRWKNPQNVSVFVKRDDQIHNIISGNKWRKLESSLNACRANKIKDIISFGGGHSNHLHALSYCCWKLGIGFTAIIRGDYTNNPTPTVIDLLKWQTNIQYVDKKTYQRRSDPDYLSSIKSQYPDAAIIPEGGSQEQALEGVAALVDELEQHYDVIIVPVASGATMAGLIKATNKLPTKVVGIAALKGHGYLEDLVEQFLPEELHQVNGNCHWHIEHNFHHGGYAKSPPELRDFCRQFLETSGFQIEPVYSGKLFFALKHMIETSFFETNQRVLAIHTGGLQGARDSLLNS